MDILIRNVDKDVVDIINDLSKDRGMNRQEFLRSYLNKVAISDVLIDEGERINDNLTEIKKLLNLVNNRVTYLEKNTEKLLEFLAEYIGVDVKKNDSLYKQEWGGKFGG